MTWSTTPIHQLPTNPDDGAGRARLTTRAGRLMRRGIIAAAAVAILGAKMPAWTQTGNTQQCRIICRAPAPPAELRG
jgi:hypothetical protein